MVNDEKTSHNHYRFADNRSELWAVVVAGDKVFSSLEEGMFIM